MSQNHELWYADAAQGLEIGTKGFTTVKATKAMPSMLRSHMENLSFYDTQSAFGKHPRFCLTRCQVGSDAWYVLTRASASTGHSKRAGFFCHHVAIHRDHRPDLNPVSLMRSAFLESTWDGKVEYLDQCRHIPASAEATARSDGNWQRCFGHASASQTMIEQLQKRRSIYVPVTDGTSAVDLMEEALTQRSVAEMWQLTFTTQLTDRIEIDLCQIKFFPQSKTDQLSIPHQQIFTGQEKPALARHAETPPLSMNPLNQDEDKPTSVPLMQDVPKKTKRAPSGSLTDVAKTTLSRPPEPPPPHEKSPPTSSQATIVVALVAFILGACLAIACCLPFLFRFQHRFEQSNLANTELQEELNKKSQSLNNSVESLHEAQGSNLKLAAQLEQSTQRYDGVNKALLDSQRTMEAREINFSNERESLEKQLQVALDQVNQLKRNIASMAPQTETQPKTSAQERELATPDPPRDSLDQILRKRTSFRMVWPQSTSSLNNAPQVIPLSGALDSMRILDWHTKKGRNRFSFSVRKDGSLTLHYGNHEFAKIQQVQDGEEFVLQVEWIANSRVWTSKQQGAEVFERQFVAQLRRQLRTIAIQEQQQERESYIELVN